MTDPKFFQIGFNKCGTRSINSLFKGNNVSCIHWDRGKLAKRIKKNFENNLPLLTGYDNFTLFSDMECQLCEPKPLYAHIDFYKELDKQYPNSKFILNIRNRSNWIKSRLNHRKGRYAKTALKIYRLSQPDLITRWEKDWDNHISDVQSYFTDKPGKLLVYNIETDNLQKLIDFSPEYRLINNILPHCGKTKIIKGRTEIDVKSRSHSSHSRFIKRCEKRI